MGGRGLLGGGPGRGGNLGGGKWMAMFWLMLGLWAGWGGGGVVLGGLYCCWGVVGWGFARLGWMVLLRVLLRWSEGGREAIQKGNDGPFFGLFL